MYCQAGSSAVEGWTLTSSLVCWRSTCKGLTGIPEVPLGASGGRFSRDGLAAVKPCDHPRGSDLIEYVGESGIEAGAGIIEGLGL